MKLINNWVYFGIFLLALFFRIATVWHGIGFHPDERAIVFSLQKMNFSNLDPQFYSYGNFIFLFTWFIGALIKGIANISFIYDEWFYLGRILSAFTGAFLVLIAGKLNESIYQAIFASKKEAKISGIFTAFLLACNPFLIQTSRFLTVDIYLTLFIVLFFFSYPLNKEGIKGIKLFIILPLFFGLAFATKISGILLILWMLPLPFLSTYLNWRKKITYFIILLLFSFFFSFLFQPFFFIDFPHYLKGVWDQINMVRGEWIPPYAVQYVGTTPFIYHLKQMWSWTITPLVSIFIILGALYLIYKIKDTSLLVKLFLIFPLVYFIIVGGSFVKFPRYLLPIYPFLAIFASIFLTKIFFSLSKRKVLKILFLILAIFTILLPALFYLSIFRTPHIYKVASYWIYNNIPAGSALIGVHWDDKLPLTMPGKESFKIYKEEPDLPLFDGDSKQKIKRISNILAQGDYIIFPTKRSYGSIIKDKKRFPYSMPFIRLLFAEKLGYKLNKSLKIYPKLFNYVYDDDLVDESLTVYDHPKVIIFKNIKRHSSEVIYNKILLGLKTAIPTNKEILSVKTNGDSWQFKSSLFNLPLTIEFIFLLQWLIVLELLGWICFILLSFYLPSFNMLSFPVSKILSPLFFGSIYFLLDYFSIIESGFASIWFIFFLVLSYSLFILKDHKEAIIKQLKRNKNIIIASYGVFYCLFLFSLFCRFIHPAMYQGEKLMDYAFFSYIQRGADIPLTDPWAVGNKMQYYYLGFVIYGVISILSAVPSYLAINFSLATVYACEGLGVFSLCYLFLKRIKPSYFATGFYVFLSSPIVAILYIFKGSLLNFDLFWLGTRFFASPAFAEFPLWSMLFGDFHPHYINAPYLLLFALLCFFLVFNANYNNYKENLLFIFIIGWILGCFLFLNTWDFIVSVLFILILLFILIGKYRYWPTEIRTKWFVVFFSLIPFVLIFISSSFGDHKRIFIHDGEFNSLMHILANYGHIFTAILVALFTCKLVFKTYYFKCFKRGYSGGGIAILPLVILIIIALYKGRDFDYFLLGFYLILIYYIASLSLRVSSLRLKAIYGLILCGIYILSIFELVVVIDRANTIFKFFTVAHKFLLIGVIGLSYMLYKKLTTKNKAIFSLLLTVVFLFSCISSFLNIFIYFVKYRDMGKGFTFNGLAHIEEKYKQDAGIIKTLILKNNKPAVIMEAWGSDYSDYGRVSSYTGNSSILAWPYHVLQRGLAYEDLQERKRDIDAFYATDNLLETISILNKYRVNYIVIGKLEKQKYGDISLKRFFAHPNLFNVLYKDNEYCLFSYLNLYN